MKYITAENYDSADAAVYLTRSSYIAGCVCTCATRTHVYICIFKSLSNGTRKRGGGMKEILNGTSRGEQVAAE